MSSTTRACCNALPQLLRLIMLIISGAALPRSFSLPTCRLACRPRATSVWASTSFFCTSWKDASGQLNWWRSNAYSRARLIQSSRAPITPQEIPNLENKSLARSGIHLYAYLAEFKQEKADPRPFDFGRSASWETWTESMNIEPVRETRRASLFLIAGADSPLTPYLSECKSEGMQSPSCIYLIDDEATNPIIPFTFRPNNKYITVVRGWVHTIEVYLNLYVRHRSIGNPRFTAIKNESTVNFFCGSFHSCGVWTMVRFGKTLENFFKIVGYLWASYYLQKHQQALPWLCISSQFQASLCNGRTYLAEANIFPFVPAFQIHE